MQDWQEMLNQDFASAIETISNTTKSDMTFYTPAGLVFRSTSPEVFEKMILGCRIDQDAFYNITYLHQRYYIHAEKAVNVGYWSLYAPIVNESGKLTAYKKVIDGLIFVQPRMIPIHVNGEITECQRPLRAQTAQGERVSLANSEQIPADSTCEFEVVLLDDSHEKVVREWMDYGVLRGIGQWRNSGKGRFNYEILD